MEKNLLRRSASGKINASRVWLFLVLMLCGMASALQVQAQAALPTAFGGRWNTTLPTGWSFAGTVTENNLNLGGSGTYSSSTGTSLTYNGGTTRSASFDGSNDAITINFSGTPGDVSFYTASQGTATTFAGSFTVWQSSNGTSWTELKKFSSNSTDGKIYSTTFSSATASGTETIVRPATSTRYIKFTLESLGTGTTSVLVDKVMIAAIPASPEINVISGASTQQANNSTYTFGQQNIKTTSDPVVFTIYNTGSQALSINTPLVLAGTNAAEFEVTEQPSLSSIPANGSTSFKVVFKPTSALSKSAYVAIANNDSDESTYTINLSGSGILKTPIITGFTPDQGAIGDPITISGTDLINTERIRFFGSTVEPTFTISNNTISTTVPANAQTGPVTLYYNNGSKTSTSSMNFTVITAPIITSFSPTMGPVGTEVTITGSNFTTDGAIYFKDKDGEYVGSGVYNYTNSTKISTTVPVGAVTGPIFVEGSELVGSTASFTVTLPAPSIDSVDPESGPVETVVTIYGTNLADVTSVSFGGVEAEFDDTDPTALVTVVPVGAQSGDLVVVTLGGTAKSTFTVIVPAPVITSFSPASGPVGTEVTITGRNFTSDGAIYFKDKDGEYLGSGVYNYTSSTQISTTVPVGAVTGTLFVEGSELVESTAPFTVTVPAPSIDRLDPNSGLVNTVVTVYGSNLANVTSVTFGGIGAQFDDSDPSALVTVVPAGAKTGDLVVTTPGGSAASSFLVLSNETLPVELVNLKATSTAKGSVLTWQTASEKDNDFFEVQSTSDLKQVEFKTIAQVDSKVTNSSAITSYQYVDNTSTTGTTYYRLKQVDLNGKFEYSKVVAVAIATNSSETASVKAYPNPFNDNQNLNLEVEAAQTGELKVVLYYVTGKKAFEQTFKVEKGASVIEVPLNKASLSAGVYILTTEINNQITTTRVVKQ